MGKLVPLLMLILGIEVMMKLILGVTTPFTSLFDLVLDPYNWSLTGFVDNVSSTIGLLAIVGITIGTLWGKSDFLIYASFAGLLFSYGQVFANLSSLIINGVNAHTEFAAAGALVAFFVVAPMIVVYIITILNFWRSSSD